jgi:hypothetical protein
MTDNHNHDRLERVERLLQDGQPTGDPPLDDLAGTTPQARPEFQQQLEDELVATLQETSDSWRQPAMIESHTHEKTKRTPRSLPVSLAATIALLLFGGLAVLFTNGALPQTPLFSGAAQQPPNEQVIPEAAALTATSIIEQATQDAAQLWTATAEAQVVLTPSLVPTGTPIPPGGLPQADWWCSGQKLGYFAEPGSYDARRTHFVTQRLKVEGTLTYSEAGQTWFLVAATAQDGESLRGWLPAETLYGTCQAGEWRPVPDEMLHTPTIVPPENAAQPLDITTTPILTHLPPTIVPPENAAQPLDITATPIPTQFPPTVPPPLGAAAFEPVQVRVADAELLDQDTLIGQALDVYIRIGSEHGPAIIPVARGVTVLKFVEVTMPNDTRDVSIEAAILPRTPEQAELLAGLAQAGIEVKLVPAD